MAVLVQFCRVISRASLAHSWHRGSSLGRAPVLHVARANYRSISIAQTRRSGASSCTGRLAPCIDHCLLPPGHGANVARANERRPVSEDATARPRNWNGVRLVTRRQVVNRAQAYAWDETSDDVRHEPAVPAAVGQRPKFRSALGGPDTKYACVLTEQVAGRRQQSEVYLLLGAANRRDGG